MKILRRFYVSTQSFVRNSSSSSEKSPQQYCINLVRNHDYENYICTVFLRRKDQACAFAIRAFNIEVARIEGQVSQAAIGQMRLKFWEESVDKIFNDKPPHHPVAQEIYRVVDKNALAKKNLRQLVSARAEKLTLSTFPSIDQMEKYAENTCSPIFYLLLASCGIENINADHAFSHLGKAQGLTNLIRSVPHYAQKRVVVLPQDVLAKYKVSHESVIRGGCEKPQRDVVYEVASRAHSHVDKVLSLVDKIPRSLYRHLFPIVPLKGYLERLRLVDFDVFHPSLQLRDTKLALKLFWRTVGGKL